MYSSRYKKYRRKREGNDLTDQEFYAELPEGDSTEGTDVLTSITGQ